jgi:hypothetical protein
MRGSLERARSELAERLRARRPEIEEALLTRTYAIADPKEAADPEYAQGLRAAVSAALDFGLAAVEHGEERAPQVPVLLLAQARLAARNNIPLDTVLRRYFAGYTTLGDFIVQEAGAANLKEPWLKRLLREQAALFDRFLAAIGEEHGRESETSRPSPEQRQAERIERLLAGELVDTSGITYEFGGWHLGLIAIGADGEQVIRAIAAGHDCRLLLLRREESALWAWLGARRLLDPVDMLRAASSDSATDSAIAIGEPGKGLPGWRLTYRQAAAAVAIVQRSEEKAVRYADVALLASALQDDLLATSLRQLYLMPIDGERDGGFALRETLRAYLDAGGSLSSAATKLGVSRRTVANRLRRAEEVIGRPLQTSLADIETALGLAQIGPSTGTSRIGPSRRR